MNSEFAVNKYYFTRKLFFIAISFFLLVSCSQRPNFSVSGKITGGKGKTIIFSKLLLDSQQPLDSVIMDNDGKFKFKDRTSGPAFFVLKISKDNFVTLLVDSAENCFITGNYKNFSNDYQVKGSVGSENMRNLSLNFTRAKKHLDSLRTIYGTLKSDPSQISRQKELENQYKNIVKDHAEFVTNFVKKNPFSLASVYALYQKWGDQDFVIKDLQTMKVAASALFSIYPKNQQVIALYQNTLEIVQNEKNKKLNEVLKEVAINSPDITLPDADGREKTLWSLHGKYVLLHFWSAKDQSSLIMNPVISEIYKKYSKRGFEIFMVSTDTDREAWMDAIQAYDLNCINVGDMKGSNQALVSYNVRSLPCNFLLDPRGEIVAKNLKGPALDKTLSQIFK